MPPPVVLVHARVVVSLLHALQAHSRLYVLSERGIDTTLRGYSVRTGREELGDTGSVEASLSETEGRTQTSSSSTNDDGIVLVIDDGVLAGDESRSLFRLQVLGSKDTGGGPCRRESSRWCADALRELWRCSLAICPVYLRRKDSLQPRIAHKAIEMPWHPCKQSARVLWDVAHASVPRMPGAWELEGNRWRMKLQTGLTWLANCMRRILAKLMMAVAVGWRAEVV